MKKTLAENVWKTVCWFDVFDQPANSKEIHRFLLHSKTSQKEVQQILDKDPRISKSFGFYFLRGKNTSVLKRCGNQFRAEKFWKRTLKHLFIFRLTPFLKTVSIGNTLAMGFPQQNSDIDLLVITEKNRLFTARAFLTFFVQIFGMRRGGKKIRGRFCLSFFISENSLNLEKIKIAEDDLYLAFWIATLVPILGNASEFFAANTWVRKIFPNLKLTTIQQKSPKKNLWEKILSGRFGDFLERILRDWQLKRATGKQKNHKKNAVIISKQMLKFHETDKRQDFLKQWESRVRS